jgi:hypothetical protein
VNKEDNIKFKGNLEKNSSILTYKKGFFCLAILSIITLWFSTRENIINETVYHVNKILYHETYTLNEIEKREKGFLRLIEEEIKEVVKLTWILQATLKRLVYTEGLAITKNDLDTDTEWSLVCKIAYIIWEWSCSTSFVQIKKNIVKNTPWIWRSDIKPVDYDKSDSNKVQDPMIVASTYIKWFTTKFLNLENIKTILPENTDESMIKEAVVYLNKDINLIITLFSTNIRNKTNINTRIQQALFVWGFINKKPKVKENVNYYNLRTITLEWVKYLERSLWEPVGQQYIYNVIYWIITRKNDVGSEITKDIQFNEHFIQRNSRSKEENKIIFENIWYFENNNLQGDVAEKLKLLSDEKIADVFM